MDSAQAMLALSVREQELLAFERLSWPQAGVKASMIRWVFGLSSIGYYAALNALVDNPVAFAADPAVVGRLRVLRGVGLRRRAGRVGTIAVAR